MASIHAEGAVIDSVESLKLVGFTFIGDPGAGAHVRAVKEKIRRKTWMLYKLRNVGFKNSQLYRLYCCYLRSIVEYCSVVYHPMLTRGQAWDLERLQRLAVRICFGGAHDTDDLMTMNGIETLEERRVRRCDTFLRKSFLHPRFGERWFPMRQEGPRTLRRWRAIEDTRAATCRRFNSPLAFLRQRANELGLSRQP